MTQYTRPADRQHKTRTSWRCRRCSRCGDVAPAGQFKVVGTFRPGWDSYGTMKRSCPSCGYQGSTHEFQVVQEHRREGRR